MDEIYSTMHRIGERLLLQAYDENDDPVPVHGEARWLPIDDFLVRLATRTRNPKLRSRKEESSSAKFIWTLGLHNGVRKRISSAFFAAAARAPTIRQQRLGHTKSAAFAVSDLTTAIDNFKASKPWLLVDFSIPAYGLDESDEKRLEESSKRLRSLERLIECLNESSQILSDLEPWLNEIRSRLSPPEGGRHIYSWRRSFVYSLAQTWWILTGRKAPSAPNTLFIEFVEMAWASAGEELPENSWERTIRAVCRGEVHDVTSSEIEHGVIVLPGRRKDDETSS